jgi:hypothetical protein
LRCPLAPGLAGGLARALVLSSLFAAAPARADLGSDLSRLKQAFAEQTRSELLPFRFMERGDITPVVLPPWALDAARGECTTVTLLSPVPTQFVVHLHPWQSLPRAYPSRAGAFQLTRCGKDRISMLQMLVEMRSPRAVVHPYVAVGPAPPAPLVSTLPERDTGLEAAPGDPGPPPPRSPLAARLQSFDERAKNAGASAVYNALLPRQGYARLALEAGCHRLLATGRDGAPRYTLLLSENDEGQPQRLEASINGDVQHELCTVRARPLLVAVDALGDDPERQLSVAHFPLPSGLPARFGPEAAERLVTALGKSAAPRRLGTLVATTLGAQGRTPLPRSLLPQTCYLAAATVLHGSAQAISLGVRAGAYNADATSSDRAPHPHLGFCTGRSGQVEIDVEARGIGLSWLFFLFQMGPARPEEP